MLVVPCHDGEAAVVGGWAVAECQLADLSLSSPLAQVSQPPVSSLQPLSSQLSFNVTDTGLILSSGAGVCTCAVSRPDNGVTRDRK